MPGLRLLNRRNTAGVHALSDVELLAMACGGDAEAFEAIYDRHAPAAFSLARRICRDQGVAEDIVQDAFLSLWRGRDRYDAARGQVRTWLLGIVHNSAIDRLRRSGVHERRRASAEGIEDRLEAPERTEEEVAQREEATEVRGALCNLPEEQRRVIELAYFDGLTHTQIASMLDQPVGTVKGRMRLGLLKLHAQLSGELTGEVTR
jgi:RNA polymerase sigma-70 factor (ECF subfamily)